MSELDSQSVKWIFDAAQDFMYAYHRYQLHQGHGQTRATALTALAHLEATVDEHVSRETSKLEAKLDGEEPPF